MTKKIFDIYQVDAFTATTFKGNPAAVIPLEEWLPDEVMLNIAKENNLAETVFFVPLKDEDFDFEIRWFTPALEVDLCGHATLASAYVLWEILGWESGVIRFQTRMAGPLSVQKVEGKIELNFPSRPPTEVSIPEGFEEANGVKPISYHRASKTIALLEDEAAVLAFVPNLPYIAGLEGDGLIITAKGDTVDCVSRYFAPHAGIDEDPVTGSAHCSIIPFWAERLNKVKLHAQQISERSGDLYCTLEGNRVRMQGHAVLYLKGQIYI